MKKLDAILRLNEEFYKKAAVSFSKTRRGYWEGWGRTVEILEQFLPGKFNVLDIGCGNGRFFRFLKEKFSHHDFTYTGIDNNETLLSEAKINFPSGKFVKKDFLKDMSCIDNQKYDLVVCFGVTHHIPTEKLRIEFFKSLGGAVKDFGFLVVTFWNFDTKKASNVNKFNGLLEKNDYILGWENKPNLFRFCHLYDKEEKEKINRLFVENGFSLVENFLDAGRDGMSADYFIWRKN